MTTDRDANHDEWIAAAAGVLERFPGRRALDELEWDAVGDFREEETQIAFAALFRAQGRVLGTTPALGVLVANRLLGASVTDTSLTTVTRARAVGDDVEAVALAGFDDASTVVVQLARSDDGASEAIEVLVADRAAWSPTTDGASALDPLAARRVRIPYAALAPLSESEPTAERRAASESLARFAIAHEILGACDRLMEIAVTYAGERQQFGTPIGSFQAVAHLLAEAEVHLRSLRDACITSMVRSGPDGPDARETVLLKGLAGQTGRKVAQHTLQVLGGIGFTWEHEHHRYSRRMLTLDALYGSVEEMRIRAVDDVAAAGVLRTAVS